MTTEHSTYTYESGAQETVTLTRGPATPHGHAVLKIKPSIGRIVDCYVNTAWLRDRLNDLGEPCPLTPDAIPVREFEAMADRALERWEKAKAVWAPRDAMREAMRAALTAPPSRPEGAEEVEALIDRADFEGEGADNEALADYLTRCGVRIVTEGEN